MNSVGQPIILQVFLKDVRIVQVGTRNKKS
jgi:hypothetical protein